MRRLLIPRSFFGLVIRIAVFNALVSLAAYAVHLAYLGSRLVGMLQIIQDHRTITTLTDAVRTLLQAG